jgi:hypothetical protein
VVWAKLVEGKWNIKKYSIQHLPNYVINLLLELQNNCFNSKNNKLGASVST